MKINSDKILFYLFMGMLGLIALFVIGTLILGAF